MITVRLSRYALVVCATAGLLAGCGARLTDVGSPPMLARPQARSADLLYVSNYQNSTVDVYTYPGGSRVATLTGFSKPQGECADAAGDVFIANTNDHDILEYAHGGTEPIATLHDSQYFPIGCSVDPVTGNLAVSNLMSSRGVGSIAIYRHARGKPRQYKSLTYFMSCSYDDGGNLFADGESNSDELLVELPKGSMTFKTVRLGLYGLGQLQWDGKYLTNELDESSSSSIFRLKISDFRARTVGHTHLSGAGSASFIDRQRVILAGPDRVDFFNYPSGKGPTKTIADSHRPIGVVVSTVSSR